MKTCLPVKYGHWVRDRKVYESNFGGYKDGQIQIYCRVKESETQPTLNFIEERKLSWWTRLTTVQELRLLKRIWKQKLRRKKGRPKAFKVMAEIVEKKRKLIKRGETKWFNESLERHVMYWLYYTYCFLRYWLNEYVPCVIYTL